MEATKSVKKIVGMSELRHRGTERSDAFTGILKRMRASWRQPNALPLEASHMTKPSQSCPTDRRRWKRAIPLDCGDSCGPCRKKESIQVKRGQVLANPSVFS